MRVGSREKTAFVYVSSWCTRICKKTHHLHGRGVFTPCYISKCQKVATQRNAPSSSPHTCHNQFFLDPSLFATLRTILFMPKAFFAAASIEGSLYTFIPHAFFFIEIHGSFNTFKYNTGEMFSSEELALPAQTSLDSSTLFPAVFAQVYSSLYLTVESIPQGQMAPGHVGHLSF